MLRDVRILIVDDEPSNVRLLQRALTRSGYRNVVGATDWASTQGALNSFDLLLLDLHMPGTDGLDVLDQLRQSDDGGYLPVLVVTGDPGPEARQAALARGARDLVTKPFDLPEVLLRVRHLLETRLLYSQLSARNRALEEEVLERARRMASAHLGMALRLCRTVELRDAATADHGDRMSQIAGRLALAAGLSRAEAEEIRHASRLHDIGKIAIPDSILGKAGALSADEYDLMKRHTVIGEEILSGSGAPLLDLAALIARSHHERWDGSGYPDGLAGEAIPLEARIVALADVFDALTQARPYRVALSREQALEMIEEGLGRHFDPDLAVLFPDALNPGVQPHAVARLAIA